MMRVKVPLRAVAAVVPAFVLCIAFLLGSTQLLKLYSNNVAYPAYMESLAMEPGDVGAEPLDTTPEAHSVADMESMDTFFAMGEIYNPGAPYTLDGRHFYQIRLDSGEYVLARINFQAAGKQKNADHQRRLPVGRWVPLEVSEEAMAIYKTTFLSVDRTDCYMDMMGDFGRAYTSGEYLTQLPLYKFLENASIVVLLASFAGFMLFFKKKGWF